MLQWGILGSSVVPACLKVAVITPILKKPSLCVNALKKFRPISNLPFLSKVIEKVVNCCSAVLPPVSSQHPWPHAVSLHTWAQHEDGAAEDPGWHQQRSGRWGVGSVLVLLDLLVAFDTIDHTILLEHLEAVAGIWGAALAWRRSCLHDKMQEWDHQWGLVNHCGSQYWGSAGIDPGPPTLPGVRHTSAFCHRASPWSSPSRLCWWPPAVHPVLPTRPGQLQACIAVAGDVCGGEQGLVAHQQAQAQCR